MSSAITFSRVKSGPARLSASTTAKAPGGAERLRGAPYDAPLRRLDETRAAREPRLVWKP